MRTFQIPRREILCKEDLDRFSSYSTRDLILDFISRLSTSVTGVSLKVAPTLVLSTTVTQIMTVLNTLIGWVDEMPPLQHEGRFGNPQFRNWIDRLVGSVSELMFWVPLQAQTELNPYFLSSFGHRQRIDFGTGNEASFMGWLFCLFRLGLLNEQDDLSLVVCVFQNYLVLMRKLQFAYWLEPAGSHGVWGLDDYHFLPFLFGASQLKTHKHLKPKSIHDPDVIEGYHKEYMYLSCIHFVNSVKSMSLKWHSPLLNDVSGVKTWDKVHSGLLKMYQAEVLAKFPIMQHFLFGSLLPFTSSVVDRPIVPFIYEETHEEICDHRLPGELPSCCVMKVPSAIASTRTNMMPFD